MSPTPVRLAAVTVPVVLLSLACLQPAASAASAAAATPATVSESDAQRSAAAVAAEDNRITAIQTVSSLSRWQGDSAKVPYRTSTSSGYTLVLTPRAQPYTVDDLLTLAPQTFQRMSDGGFLLSEHIVVTSGAALRLDRPGGLTLRLSSSGRGFVTIVSMGGEIDVAGTESAPVKISSWNVDTAQPDRDLTDGRAYVRAIGGQFNASYLQASQLGFWSGRTGGIALTGTDRPNTGAIEPLHGAAPDPSVPSALEGVTTQPAGPLGQGQTDPGTQYTVPSSSYVSSRLTHTTVDGDAFGLFVSGANGIQISDSAFTNSAINGVVLHRYVSNGVVSTTTSSHNAGNGFTLDRASTGITLSEATATANADSGVVISGRPLADGPSSVGSPTSSYGGNSVANSTVTGNGHYGIHVLGGFNVGVQNNHVSDNEMGIVVSGPADRISVTGNQIGATASHGIALMDGVTNSTVTANVVDGARTGVYVRASSVDVVGNSVQAASLHGVSLVGEVAGSDVDRNVLSGSGASAMDSTRSRGKVVAEGNQDNGWHDTSPWYFAFKRLLHPMNALWASLFALVLLSALRSRRVPRGVAHPYAHQIAHHDRLAAAAPAPVPAVIDLREPVGSERVLV